MHFKNSALYTIVKSKPQEIKGEEINLWQEVYCRFCVLINQKVFNKQTLDTFDITSVNSYLKDYCSPKMKFLIFERYCTYEDTRVILLNKSRSEFFKIRKYSVFVPFSLWKLQNTDSMEDFIDWPIWTQKVPKKVVYWAKKNLN